LIQIKYFISKKIKFKHLIIEREKLRDQTHIREYTAYWKRN